MQNRLNIKSSKMRTIFILCIFYIFNLNLLPSEISRTQVLMGTYATISLQKENSPYISKAFDLIREIELSLSSYNKDAKVYKLNKNREVTKDIYLQEVISKALKMYRDTDGYFDITVGSLTKNLYRFGEDEQIPSKGEIQKAKVDIDGVKIAETKIYLQPDITIDLGGIGKGYAVDKVASYLKSKDIKSGKIALSGDIRAIDPATIYIESPFKDTSNIKIKTLHNNTSISTSGTYRRFIKDISYHHLIDPKRKESSKEFVSVTLIAIEDNTLIDALATAVGAMGEMNALKLLLKYPNIGFILIKSNKNIIYANLKGLAKIYID